MASINSALVRRELRAMANASNVIRKQLEQMFKQLEKDPSRYPELDEVDPRIIIEFPNLVLRKVYLTHRRHNFRIVFAH